GGASKRMGRNKAFIEIEGERIIDRTVRVFNDLFDEVMIVSNAPLEYAYLGVRVVTDLLPHRGSLGGLYTGLYLSSSSKAFFVSCDMPFLNKKVISYFISRAEGVDLVVYHCQSYWEPLHAVYSQSFLKPFERLLQHGELKIVEAYKHMKIREVKKAEIQPFDPDLHSLTNINTPADLQKICSLTRTESPSLE
ncbi:MAG TPA: molybdenum cofactor guanylyltransferase, partial [Thermodesulfobacteriota bacterium]|nr:molybdenum cofactor guanylyltransferase [Thermodesulfobacteriota bacterium]